MGNWTEVCWKEISAWPPQDTPVESVAIAWRRCSSPCREFKSAQQDPPFILYFSIPSHSGQKVKKGLIALQPTSERLQELFVPQSFQAVEERLCGPSCTHSSAMALSSVALFSSLLPSLCLLHQVKSGHKYYWLLLCLKPDKPVFCQSMRTQKTALLSQLQGLFRSKKNLADVLGAECMRQDWKPWDQIFSGRWCHFLQSHLFF